MNKPNRHPAGETETRALVPFAGPVPVDTFGGRVHVEWDRSAAFTLLGQLPFFTEFLQVGGLLDPLVESCPLLLTSPNAPSKRDVLGTVVLAILSGHQRYAHISALRGDTVNPPMPIRMMHKVAGGSFAPPLAGVRMCLGIVLRKSGLPCTRQFSAHCRKPPSARTGG